MHSGPGRMCFLSQTSQTLCHRPCVLFSWILLTHRPLLGLEGLRSPSSPLCNQNTVAPTQTGLQPCSERCRHVQAETSKHFDLMAVEHGECQLPGCMGALLLPFLRQRLPASCQKHGQALGLPLASGGCSCRKMGMPKL